ncbi:MAG: Cache 3/Cache 2 fusion domain-containing protein [Deferrisomatales bacterium]
MTRFRDWTVRRKLAATLCAVVLPLLAAEGLAIWSVRTSLRGAAELELTNLVNHLHHLCEAQRHLGNGRAGPGEPSAEDLRFLREIIRPLKVGATGYPYILDRTGTLVVHPTKEGQNILDSRDTKGFPFIEALRDAALGLPPGELGTIRYPWRNEEAGETRARTKMLRFRHLAEWDWIIAAGSYEEEVYAAVGRLGLYTAPLVAASALLVVALTFGLGRLITQPLERIAEAAGRMAEGDTRARVSLGRSGDELAAVAEAFNAMARQVHEKTAEMERLIAERTEALRESHEQYRSLVESAVEGIVTTDFDGVVTFVNPAFEQMIGRPRADLLGQPASRFHPGGDAQARQLMSQLLQERGSRTGQETQLLARDRTLPVRASASILRDPAGLARGTLILFTDLTAEKRLATELGHAQANLVQSMKLQALGDLVAGVAHEINNPLMASSTMLHVMERSRCPEGCPNRQALRVLRRCNDRIAKIVSHLRDFSRQTPQELADVDLNEVLENALIITSQQLLNQGIEIARELAPDLPAVRGDANRLEQAVLDLVANARDAMQGTAGRRVLGLRTRPDRLDGRPAVAVEVWDTGPGVPAAIRDQIFEPFFTTKEAGRGTGLGLSITYGIVAEHGGRVELADPGPGRTTFRILLPAGSPSPAAA